QELRRRQLAAVIAWATAGARVQPVVLVLEDLHWADPTTIDVLRGIAERGALAPLLVLATARPEFRPPCGVRSHHSTISARSVFTLTGTTARWKGCQHWLYAVSRPPA